MIDELISFIKKKIKKENPMILTFLDSVLKDSYANLFEKSFCSLYSYGGEVKYFGQTSALIEKNNFKFYFAWDKKNDIKFNISFGDKDVFQSSFIPEELFVDRVGFKIKEITEHNKFKKTKNIEKFQDLFTDMFDWIFKHKEFWKRAEQYDVKIQFRTSDEIQITLLKEKYGLVLFFEKDKVSVEFNKLKEDRLWDKKWREVTFFSGKKEIEEKVLLEYLTFFDFFC